MAGAFGQCAQQRPLHVATTSPRSAPLTVIVADAPAGAAAWTAAELVGPVWSTVVASVLPWCDSSVSHDPFLSDEQMMSIDTTCVDRLRAITIYRNRTVGNPLVQDCELSGRAGGCTSVSRRSTNHPTASGPTHSESSSTCTSPPSNSTGSARPAQASTSAGHTHATAADVGDAVEPAVARVAAFPCQQRRMLEPMHPLLAAHRHRRCRATHRGHRPDGRRTPGARRLPAEPLARRARSRVATRSQSMNGRCSHRESSRSSGSSTVRPVVLHRDLVAHVDQRRATEREDDRVAEQQPTHCLVERSTSRSRERSFDAGQRRRHATRALVARRRVRRERCAERERAGRVTAIERRRGLRGAAAH